MKKYLRYWLILCCINASALAGEVNIISATLTKQPTTWHVAVTIKHADSGWEHYADAWRIVDKNDAILGMRILAHPHVYEQPFTRTLSNVAIPLELKTVYIKARDNMHGWSKQRLRVDLTPVTDKKFNGKIKAHHQDILNKN